MAIRFEKVRLREELRRQKWRWLAAIAGVVLVLDQYTKWVIYSRFRWGESFEVIRDFFAITFVRNTGAAFGLMQQAPSWFREPFFLIVPLVAIAVILVVFARLNDAQRLSLGALSLVFGGAVGNLIDRVRFGYVVDFLDFHWKDRYHYPAFNVADSAIVVGVAILFLMSFRAETADAPSASDSRP